MKEFYRLNGRNYFVFLLLFSFLNIGNLFAQGELIQTITPRISGGAAYIEALHRGLIPAFETFGDTTKFMGQTNRVSTNLIGSVVEAIDFEQNGANNGYYHIPPDNAGCVGSNHFLLAVNTSIEWYTKDGTRQHTGDLDAFFNSTSPTYGLFDPRVLYDQYNDRFVVIALEKDATAKVSYIHIAVSQTTDPNGSWNFQKINSKLNISGVDCWADFPCMGLSNNAIYISCNMFDFSSNNFQGSRLWILDKGLYSGSSSNFTVYDPSTEVGESSQSFTLFPTHSFGSLPGTTGAFLCATGWVDGSNNDYLQVIRIDDPFGNIQFSESFLYLGDIHDNSSGVPNAPQLGSSNLIDFGDNRMQSCVWRNNRLVGAFTANPPTGSEAGQATAFWFDISTTNLSALSVTQQGYVDGEDIATGTYTSYPAVTINQDGDIAIGFSASGSNIYAGSYYTLHTDSDPNGQVEASQTLHGGVDWYYRTFSGSRNRWGDYSSISVDPADDLNFWVFNQYAWTRGSSSGGDGRWATSFANFGTIETPQFLKADNITSTSLDLHWSGRSAEFRLLQDGSELYSGSDTSFSVTGLTANTSYTFQVYGKASGQAVYSADYVSLEVTTAPSGNNDNPTETVASTPTISSGGGTSEFEIEGTGTWLTFPTGTTTSSSFTTAKKSGDPGIVGSLPSGISKIATDRNWTVTASAGTNVGTYNIRFDLSGVGGIQYFNTLKILKRDDSSSPWQKVEDLGATYTYNEPYITVSGLTSFSDFAIASSGDNSLPVEFSSFFAEVTDGLVRLHWRTESEVENLGFILQRSEDQGKSYFTIADYQSNPQLIGHGNSSHACDYSFIDSTVQEGNVYWYKVLDVALNGVKNEHGPIRVEMTRKKDNLNRVESGLIPEKVILYPNSPNPFNPVTTIKFAIPELKHTPMVELSIFDVKGRKVKTLFKGELASGVYSITWDGRAENDQQVTSGMYISFLRVNSTIKTNKLLLVR